MTLSRVLLVGDSRTLPEGLTAGDCAGALAAELDEVTVESATDRRTALDALDADVDCVVSGIPLAAEGLAFLRAVRERDQNVPVVYLATSDDESVPLDALSLGVTDHHCLRTAGDPVEQLAAAVSGVHDGGEADRDPAPTGGEESGGGVGEDTGAQYRKLVRHIGDPVYMLDENGYIQMVNEALLEGSGYERGELVGEHVSAVMPEEDVQRGTEVIMALLADDERTSDTFEMEFVMADGSREEYEDHVTVLRDEDGEYAGSVGIVRDISDRKQRERELQQYEAVVEAVDDLVYAVDEDGHFQFVNEAQQSMTGYDREALLGEHVSVLMDEQSRAVARQHIEELRESDRQSVTFERTATRKDGETFECEDHMAMLPAEDGEFRGTAGIIRDITERKERERELEQYETIVETVPEGVFVLDEEANIVAVNEQGVDLFDVSRERALEMSVPDLIDEGIIGEDIVEGYRETVRDLLSSGTDAERGTYEYTAYPGGDTDDARTIETRIALRPYDEEFRGTIGVMQDVTERKQRIEELERYETLVETVPDGVYALDEDGFFDFYNQAAVDQFGYDEEDIRRGDVHFTDVVADEDVEKFVETTRRLLSPAYDLGGKSVVEFTALAKDGHRFPAESHFAVLGEEGTTEYQGTVGIARDITERKQRRERLDVLNRVLRHNLRNDLNAIIGSSDLLAERLRLRCDDEEGAAIAEQSSELGKELVEMSDEVRQIGQALERDGIERPTIDAVDVVESVVEEYRADTTGAHIETDLPDRAVVEADETLELVVENLVENAIEHNDSDVPRVAVTVGDRPDGRGEWYELRVGDNGPGIPEQEEVVVDEDTEVTPLQHASGIGLWAVAWIVQSFEGEVAFETDGTGTDVVVTLRAASG